MKHSSFVDRVLVLFWLATAALLIPKLVVGHAWPYDRLLGPPVLKAIGHASRLGWLIAGAVYAIRGVSRLGARNPVRKAWLLLASFLLSFCVAGTTLLIYDYGLDQPDPMPSAADPFFLVGYVSLLASITTFVRVYRASGFPVGTASQHRRTAAATALPLAVLGYLTLAPIVTIPRPWLERCLNITYPLLDMAALVPSVVLLRITLRFRPGSVWTVWGALIFGFVTLSAADVLFAYFSSAGMVGLEPLGDTMFAFGYSAVAYGVIRQHALLAEGA